MKKMIIAPDSFKGSLSARDVCHILAESARTFFPDVEIIQLLVADGGEGLVDALLYAEGGKKIWVSVKDPLWRDIQAYYGILGSGTAVIEMAAASGLPLLKLSERNVLETTTYGTGQLIRDALEKDCRKFILGLGGSATNDGGAGAAGALEIRYLGNEDQPIYTGGNLRSLVRIDSGQMQEALKQAHFTIACDVNNPLYGSNGAAATYGPQKGASQEDILLLDEGLQKLAAVILQQKGIDLQSIPGTGAAGGMVAPFIAFTNAVLKRGLDVVLDAVHFDDHLEGCDLVVTGEGRTDYQSSMGKVLSGIGQRAAAKGVPVITLSGALQSGYEGLYENGISAAFAAVREVQTLESALANSADNLRRAAGDVFRLIRLGLS